jgi:hypothetical protein
MISTRLKFTDIDPVHWARLLDLMLPPPGGDPELDLGGGALATLARVTSAPRRSSTALSPEMPAVVLYRKGRIVRIVRLGGGTLPPDALASPWPEDLRRFRKSRKLPFVAAVDLDALPWLMAEAQRRVALDDDLVAQQLAMLNVFREALGRTVHVDPTPSGEAPPPAHRLLQLTFDRLLPDDTSLVFYLADGRRLWTSLIAAKRGGDLHVVTTHAAIADRVRFGSIRADAKAVLSAVAERFEPPHIGMFLPLQTWHELVAGDRSAIARALAVRRAVIDPAPPWLLALVGAGAMAEGLTRGGRLAGQLLSSSKLGSRLLGGKAAGRVVQTLSNPLETIGLDPWELLRWGRDWRRRVQLERDVFDQQSQHGGEAV